MQAYNLLPERPEALYRLCKTFRLQKQYPLAHLFYEKARTVVDSTPEEWIENPPLFLEKNIGAFLLDMEIVSIGFYVHKMTEGRAAIERLLAHPQLNQNTREWVLKNAVFYSA